MTENAILVAVKKSTENKLHFKESIKELKLLADTAKAQVVEVLTQERRFENPLTYIGKGKVEELKNLADSKETDLIIVNDQLTSLQERNLSSLIGKKIIDRTALILDIFASSAHSKEGKIQVEVAQYNYLLPRLTGKGVTLSRLGGGIGTRGPGETMLEVDRRRIRKTLNHLNKQLKKIEKQRNTQRKKRSLRTEKISLVGYTNSGKSTLLNSLTKAKAEVADKLFSTVDAKTRRLYINKDGGRFFTISDTVGFIEKLPTMLIEAFKSTLIEVQEADIVLHVIDASNKNFEGQIRAVENILNELKVKANVIKVFNKIDLLEQETLDNIKENYPKDLKISALKNLGIEKLKRRIVRRLKDGFSKKSLAKKSSKAY